MRLPIHCLRFQCPDQPHLGRSLFLLLFFFSHLFSLDVGFTDSSSRTSELYCWLAIHTRDRLLCSGQLHSVGVEHPSSSNVYTTTLPATPTCLIPVTFIAGEIKICGTTQWLECWSPFYNHMITTGAIRRPSRHSSRIRWSDKYRRNWLGSIAGRQTFTTTSTVNSPPDWQPPS